MIFQIATKEIEIIKATYEMIIVLVSILPLSDMSDSVTTQWSSRRTRGFFLKRQMQSTPFAPLTPSRPSFGRRAKGLAWSTYRAMLWQGLSLHVTLFHPPPHDVTCFGLKWMQKAMCRSPQKDDVTFS